MTNSKTTFAVQLAEANNTVQAKGLVLSQWDKSITKGDKSRFKALCARDGFWFSLGEICLELLKQSGGNRTDSALLKDANLHTVAKQRRKEAMDFVLNFKVIEDNKLLGKFASMKELLKAVDKIVNPKVEQSDEPKAETPVEPKATEKEPKVEPKVLSASDIALEALVQCELNGISKAKFLSALKEQLEMLDDSTDKSVIKAVA